jgi:YD repeat-containing protein
MCIYLVIYYQIKPMYNGNIAETYWRTLTDNILREYSYVYDDMNRLTDTFYNKPESTVTFPVNYNTRFVTYDKNGNIQLIKRYGDNDLDLVLIDQIFFIYQAKSNQLLSVRDDSSHPGGFTDRNSRGYDYTYDSNGNLTSDKNKGITSISYNHLNLPEKNYNRYGRN